MLENNVTKAWMAGFIDGEGCLTISKQIRKNRPTPQWRPFITIANTNKESLEIFYNTYGGTIRFNKEKIESKAGIKWSDSWTWYCRQSSIEKLCSDVMPYLIIKKQQAQILIDFLSHTNTIKREKGGRTVDGKFKGSSPLSVVDISLKDFMRDNIQSLNSGKRFKQAI